MLIKMEAVQPATASIFLSDNANNKLITHNAIINEIHTINIMFSFLLILSSYTVWRQLCMAYCALLSFLRFRVPAGITVYYSVFNGVGDLCLTTYILTSRNGHAGDQHRYLFFPSITSSSVHLPRWLSRSIHNPNLFLILFNSLSEK